MPPSPLEQADQRIKAVEQAFDRAEGAWFGAGMSIGALFGLGASSDQVLGAIASMRRLGLGPWSARARKLAPSDADGWKRWVQDGNDMLHNLATTAQEADAGTLDGILVDTVIATAVQVKDDTVKAATAVWDAKYQILALVLLLGGAAVYVSWKR
jgi:hypothetical protein